MVTMDCFADLILQFIKAVRSNSEFQIPKLHEFLTDQNREDLFLLIII